MKESLSQFTNNFTNKVKEIMNKKNNRDNSENNNEKTEKDNKEDNNDNLKQKKEYSILSPTKVANISGYEDALDFVFLNDSIKNVAISGAYCSGKSSIIETYEEDNKKKRKFLHISLAHFCALCQTDKEKMIDGKDKATIETKILTRKLIKNDKNRATIETKIINQLIQQIPDRRIKQTNFKIKKDYAFLRAIALSLILCLFSALLLLVVKFHSWENYYNKELKNDFLKTVLEMFSNPEARFFSVVILLVIIGFIVFKLIYAQYTSGFIRKISFQGNEIEIGNDSNDSFFDKYLNEVIYIFDKADADAIVFEDIDRFDDVALFEKLREINTLVNIRKSRKLLKKNRKPLRFLYMLKDDLFVEFKERTKFFDFIIPVIPVVDGSNSYGVIKAKLEKAGMFRLFDEQFLNQISLYIDDFRILKNVINELFLYDERLNKGLGDKHLDSNRLLAIIVYKNIFPKDYDELRFRKGCVYSFFAAENIIREAAKSPLYKRENSINKEIKELKEKCEEALSKLDKEYDLNNEVASDSQQQKENGWVTDKYEEEKSSIQSKYNGSINRLENIIIQLHEQQIETESLSFSELLSRYSEEVFNPVFLIKKLKISEKIVNDNYFGLIKYLLSGGYIDASYADYMTYHYENGLSLNDNYFIRSVLEHTGLEYGYHIDSPERVMDFIKPKDFSQTATLNYDLYDYVFSKKDLLSQKQQARLLFESSKRYDHIGFIEGYLLSGKDTGSFIKFLTEVWKDVFDYVYDNFSEEALTMFCVNIINNSTYEELLSIGDENSLLSSFISSTPSIFTVGIERDKLLSSLLILSVKIVDLENENIDASILEYLYKNELYDINATNICFLLKTKCEVEDISNTLKYFFSFVFNNRDKYPFCKYVEKYFRKVIPIYLGMYDGEIEDDSEIACRVINCIDTMVFAEKYIKQLNIQIDNIAKLENLDILPLLIKYGHIVYNAKNIICWYDQKKKITPELISFIQSDDSVISYDLEDDKTKGFLSELLRSDELSNEKYIQIVQSLSNRTIDVIKASHIPENRMRELIDSQVLDCSEKTKEYIRTNYPNLLEIFIYRNIDSYFSAQINEMEMDDLSLVLTSELVSEEKKIELLQKCSNPISLVDKQYPESVVLYVLEHNFNLNDIEWLARNYSSFSDSVKKAITTKIVNDPSIIIRINKEMNHELKIIILGDHRIDFSQRVRFLSMYLDEIDEEDLSELLIALGANKIAANIEGTKNKLIVDQKNMSILRVLWKKRIILYPQKTPTGKQYQKLQYIPRTERPHVPSRIRQ